MRTKTVAVLAPVCVVAIIGLTGIVRGADEFTSKPQPMFAQYCYQCHGKAAQLGGISLEQLTAKGTVGDSFAQWTKVAAALEQGRMPPKGMPQPSDPQRHQAVAWVRAELAAYAKKHDGDPGRVTVRRLTSGEYGYAIEDLTGIKLDVGIDSAGDSVGGEGFTNFGDVQFMQEANLERYLEAAKKIADHAVIGAGPIEFFADPGKTGFELSAITRLKDIYGHDGFRTVSGEGGIPFGLDKYGKAFYAAWRYQHRAALGEPNVQMKDVAAREQVSARLAQHIYTTLNRTDLGYPASEVAVRWKRLPAPAADAKATEAVVRTQCDELQKYLTTWPSWLFSRGDVAVGGAGDESPLIFNDASLKVTGTHHFVFNVGGRGGGGGRGRGAPAAGPTKVYLNVAAVTANPNPKAVIVWHNATVSFGRGGFGRGGQGGGGAQPAPPAAAPAGVDKPPVAQPAGAVAQPVPAGAQPIVANAGAGGAPRRGFVPPPGQPLRTAISEQTAKKLNFGNSPDGSVIGPDDFASDTSVAIELQVPEGTQGVIFQVDAQMGKDRDQVFRITLSDREDGGSRGIPVRTLLGDPDSAGYKVFKAGVMELAAILPPNSHNEPTPADKDPVPLPFDSTYNVPEHDAFDTRVKYLRDDKFVYTHVLDDATRKRVDQAWADLYTSFEYHDNYLGLLADHYKYDLKGKHIGDLDKAQLDAMPAELRKYVIPVHADYVAAVAAEKAALPHHMQDCLKFASMAWRRPLSEKERLSLIGYYDKAMTLQGDHREAIRAVIARILVSPAFLYRVEQLGSAAPAPAAAIKPLADWEMASRLSFFLWASIPDEELRRAAAAGELSNPPGIQKQVKRMLADAKARRLSTEFFGQWLGFYHFDEFKGVDTTRFPEFTADVRDSMYDEAVSFFEYIVRQDRPVREILTADYAFLDQPLAKFYGIKKEVKSKDHVELVPGANAFQRGGLLRLGAVLTAFSAPLRTSPVKRGDWVLRRVLGTAVPPPPADAGSIPNDDKLFGGLSLKAKLEQHKRNATCAACHLRIDPLGFPLEHYDSTGRWREKYADGKPIEDTSALSDQTEIAGVDGLLKYLLTKDEQVRRTLANKMLGYALGRTVQASDQTLIERMVSAGSDARMSQLAGEIAVSKQFRNHMGPETAPVTPVKVALNAALNVASAAAVRNSDKVGSR